MDSSVPKHLETAEAKVVEMQRTVFSTQKKILTHFNRCTITVNNHKKYTLVSITKHFTYAIIVMDIKMLSKEKFLIVPAKIQRWR